MQTLSVQQILLTVRSLPTTPSSV